MERQTGETKDALEMGQALLSRMDDDVDVSGTI